MLDEALARWYGTARLSQAVTRLMVTGYWLERREPIFFKSWETGPGQGPDHPMTEVGRATVSGPVYFEPARMTAHPGTDEAMSVIDGGVCVNNPAMSAYAELRRERIDDILVVSVGAGTPVRRPLRFARVRHWGIPGWVLPGQLFSLTLDGQSQVVEYQMRQVLARRPDRWYPFQVELGPHTSEALDDVSCGNLDALHRDAERLLEECTEQMDSLVAALSAVEAARPASL